VAGESVVAISARLGVVAGLCLRGARVADVGADHGRLAEYLVLQGIARSVICTDLNDAPARKARARVAYLDGRTEVRQGDGLAPIRPGEVDVVCIAGMSGRLMADILDRGLPVLAEVARVVLQPLCHERALREWLAANSWRLIGEETAEERGRQYDTLVAAHGDGRAPYTGNDVDTLLEMGPFLSTRPTDAFQRKWNGKLRHLREVAAGRARAGDGVGAAVADGRIAMIEGVLSREGRAPAPQA
jgi:tRNA (adenine22-N1)-methyltransferase